jgi:hypothetical protein
MNARYAPMLPILMLLLCLIFVLVSAFVWG